MYNAPVYDASNSWPGYGYAPAAYPYYDHQSQPNLNNDDYIGVYGNLNEVYNYLSNAYKSYNRPNASDAYAKTLKGEAKTAAKGTETGQTKLLSALINKYASSSAYDQVKNSKNNNFSSYFEKDQPENKNKKQDKASLKQNRKNKANFMKRSKIANSLILNFNK